VPRKKPSGDININLDASPDLNALFNNLLNGVSKEFPELKSFNVPLVLAFKVRIENGNAIVENISATPSVGPQPQHYAPTHLPQAIPRRSVEREPLVDVVENDRQATVAVELRGALSENITVTAGACGVKVHALTTRGIYDREVRLRHNIDPKGASARHNNGVLEITLPVCAEEQSETLIKVR
jgi:HSP20 family molecular chaperone IbpA